MVEARVLGFQAWAAMPSLGRAKERTQAFLPNRQVLYQLRYIRSPMIIFK